ncbi:fungal-specific transcription factor domain-containing protein [Xylogone sp. PMI_703]|nr:fungal-specific transcription factor domain-containing protein [Xylogone sp. PMI_703]
MAHTRRVRKERRCPFCSLTFSKEEHLSRHIRAHTKEKPFGCITCGKMFTRNDTLLRHARSHNDSKENLSSTSHQNQLNDNKRSTLPDSVGDTSEAIVALLDMQHVPSPAVPTDQRDSEQGQQLLHRPSYGDISIRSPASIQTSTSPMTNSTFPGIGRRSWYDSVVSVDSSHGNLQSSMLPTGSFHSGSPTGEDVWDINLNQQIPGWLVGDDFDLTALNSVAIPSTYDWHDFPTTLPDLNLPSTDTIQADFPVNTGQERPEDVVRCQWFTYLVPEQSGHITPEIIPEKTQVDEQYRESLSKQLQQRVLHEALPSTDFLNLCIQMYFTRFNPIFPIVHAPTFRPSERRSLLLLSICSVGSLFLGSPYATAQGKRIFESLNKAILASWESYMVRGSGEALAMTQAALIGQTFGMLSGSPRHLAIVQTFHGTVIAWARRQKMFEQNSAPIEMTSSSEADLDRVWKKWVHAEEKLRVTVGLRIHDCELAELFMTEPFLRNAQSKLPRIANDELWTASTANKWASTLKGQGYQSSTLSIEDLRCTKSSEPHRLTERGITIINWLAVYDTLESLATTIIESRCSNSLDKVSMEIQDSLLHLYERHLRGIKSDVLCLQPLWHSVFISLFCDINRLEIVAGREGYERAKEEEDYVTEWASSRNGHRCALHAALILKRLEGMSIGSEPAIHVPRLLFRASLVWYTYTRLGHDNEATGIPVEFPELTKLGIEGRKLLFEANGFKFTRPATAESSTLCCLVDLLRRGGHWGISRKMTSLLSLLIYGSLDMDGNVMG